MCFIRAQTKTQPYWSLIPIAARASRPAGSRISFYTPNLRPPHFQARAERALRLSAVSRRRGSESTSQTPPNPLLFHRELIRYLTHHALEKYFFKERFFLPSTERRQPDAVTGTIYPFAAPEKY
jgi:hypothetical protein